MLLLNIDTAIDKGSFCISDGLSVVAFEQHEHRNEQAGWLHEAIYTTFQDKNIDMKSLDAIAVSNGPGSYTGLRIGLASAKGFCYALNKPLICINTLQIMANAVKPFAIDLICPMIDARRMEVFTAFYTKNMEVWKEPFAEVLTEKSFTDLLNQHHIIFTGNGSSKLASLIEEKENLQILNKNLDARDMISLSVKFFEENNFSNVAYSQPYYVKEVYIAKSKSD